jgi:hypothetical protein
MYRLLELASQFIALKYDYTFHKINKYWMLFLIPLSAFAYTAVGLCLYRCRPLLILLSAFAYTAVGLCLYCCRPLLILLSAFAYTAVGLCLYCCRPFRPFHIPQSFSLFSASSSYTDLSLRTLEGDI